MRCVRENSKTRLSKSRYKTAVKIADNIHKHSVWNTGCWTEQVPYDSWFSFCCSASIGLFAQFLQEYHSIASRRSVESHRKTPANLWIQHPILGAPASSKIFRPLTRTNCIGRRNRKPVPIGAAARTRQSRSHSAVSLSKSRLFFEVSLIILTDRYIFAAHCDNTDNENQTAQDQSTENIK